MRKTVILILWLTFVAGAIAVIAHTQLSTDMSAFLPGAPTPQQQILIDQLHDGAVSRVMLLGIEGAAPDKLAVLSKNLARRLYSGTDFALVRNGEADDFAADRAFLFKHRYQLNPAVTPDRFTAPGLHQALVNDLTLLRSNMAALVEPMLAADPTGEAIGILTGMEATHPATQDGVWMSKDGARAVMLLQTRAAGFDIDAQQQALNTIAQEFADAQEETDIFDAHLLETGPGVFAVQSRDSMKRDATRFSTIATFLVAAILLTVYRSPRILALALLPVASGALAGMAAVSLDFGYVHGITLGFGVTLIGEAVDYAIYLFTQTPPGEAPAQTLPRIWPTLLLGMLTSVVGFSAMLFSGFSGFAQLGLFTIAGLIVALCVTRFVLPVLLPRGFAAKTSALPKLQILARYKMLPFIMGAIAVLALCLHSGPFWEDDIASMSPLSPTMQALDKQLRQDTAAPDLRYLIAIDAPTQEQALQKIEALAVDLQPAIKDKTLDGYDYAARYLPSEAAQKARQAALPDPVTLANNLTAALAGLPFKPDYFQPFIANAASAKEAALITRDDFTGTTLTLKLDTLLTRHGEAWRATMPLYAVHDPARVTAIALQNHAFLLDLKGESNNLLHAYRREAITLSLVGSAGIACLLLLSLKSLPRVVRVVLPLALAVLVTTALVTIGAHKLSIFTLFGLLLTVAIGSNYCLFFERQKGDPAHHERTAASLALANICTVIGFGILSFSSIPVLHGIGGTVAIGAVLSLIFGAMLIPDRGAA